MQFAVGNTTKNIWLPLNELWIIAALSLCTDYEQIEGALIGECPQSVEVFFVAFPCYMYLLHVPA